MSPEQFWKKVTIRTDNECWEWQGAITGNGYGNVRWQGRTEKAHRVSYLLTQGKIPPDKEICHSCDNRRCVNPNHLWLGTRSENLYDMSNKGRHWAHVHPESVLRGEQNPMSKLTQSQVDEIRARYAKGNIGTQQLGNLFGVSKRAIQCVVKRITYK